MLMDPLAVLACPHCARPLERDGSEFRCASGHVFDIARQGYVNLVTPGTHTGTADTPAMVAARQAFFAAGHFAPLVERVAEVVASAAEGVLGRIVDVGGGSGEYLAAALDRLPDRHGMVLDLSKHACKRAARSHERASAAVCDTWTVLPLAEGSAAVLMNVFAPRNAAEFARVLVPGGALVVVTPTPAHLAELVAALGLVTVDPEKDERLEALLMPYFERTAVETLERRLALTAEAAALAVAMGPSSRHVDPETLAARLGGLGEPIETTLSASVSTWRKR